MNGVIEDHYKIYSNQRKLIIVAYLFNWNDEHCPNGRSDEQS